MSIRVISVDIGFRSKDPIDHSNSRQLAEARAYQPRRLRVRVSRFHPKLSGVRYE